MLTLTIWRRHFRYVNTSLMRGFFVSKLRYSRRFKLPFTLRRATSESSRVWIGGHIPPTPPLEISRLAISRLDHIFGPVTDIRNVWGQPEDSISRLDLSVPTALAYHLLMYARTQKNPKKSISWKLDVTIVLSVQKSKKGPRTFYENLRALVLTQNYKAIGHLMATGDTHRQMNCSKNCEMKL